MSSKRYYWLKLNENFFDDETIIWIEEGENGKDHVIFYLKLLLKSVAEEGVLVRYVGEQLIPYDVNALARLTNTKPDTVKVAMERFNKIGLVSILEHGEIYMNQVKEMIGTETASAVRKRRQRALAKKEEETLKLESKRQRPDNVQKCHTEIDIELELEKDIETEKEQHHPEKNEKFDVDEDFKKVSNFYQDNLGPLSPFNAEDIQLWIEDLSADLVIEALERTVENQKRYSYAKGIMKNWVDNNIKTMDDVKAMDVSFNNHSGKTVQKERDYSSWKTQ